MCRREAPGIEQLARDHGDEILVVGLGVTDSFTQAESFAAMTGIGSFPVVWSESFDPAALLGVFAHPAWVLLSPSGEIVDSSAGSIDTDDLLEKAASI